jgi:SAM-dependent methyltransferase
VADEAFGNPRLAALYDPLNPDRSDLETYLRIAIELGARDVVDVGCGTGTFALLLAASGFAVTGVDPARASLAVAAMKRNAARVRWIHGAAQALPGDLRVDLATMTGNVAQAIVDPVEWRNTLHVLNRTIRPDGHLVFETRDPARRAWERWTRERTVVLTDPGTVDGPIRTWVELLDVSLPLVTFRGIVEIVGSGERLVSTSTLRFRERGEAVADLTAAGFVVADVREAPDRPGREFVFICRRCDRASPR